MKVINMGGEVMNEGISPQAACICSVNALSIRNRNDGKLCRCQCSYGTANSAANDNKAMNL